MTSSRLTNGESSDEVTRLDEDGPATARGLVFLLADTIAVSTKTLGFHWNVGGVQFGSLYVLFERQWRELSKNILLLGMRIRALGSFAPGSLSEIRVLSNIPDQIGVPVARDMVTELIRDHASLVVRIQQLRTSTEVANDHPTGSLLDQLELSHQNFCWMLNSSLEEFGTTAVSSVLLTYISTSEQ